MGSVMMLALLGGVFFALQESRVFAINAIPLQWNGRLDRGRMEAEIARDIEAGIGVRFANVMGKRPWEIDLENMARGIRDLPWIMEARIQRVFPDRLVVSIVPKRPVAVVVSVHRKTRQGLLRPMTEDGELMADWTSSVVPDVPFLRGEGFLHDPRLRQKTAQLLRALPSEGVLARSNLAEVSWTAPAVGGEVSKDSGFSILLLSPRTEIRLGTGDIETKLVRVAHVLNYLSTEGKKAPVIDSTSVKKVVVRAHHRP